MEEIVINVGIKTFGPPQIESHKDYLVLKNMLIGDSFHWQSSLAVKLPGELHPFNGKDNISLVNTLPLETYIECVACSEMNPSAPLEFLKAHTVISRSWALGKVLGVHASQTDGQFKTATKIIGWDDTADHKGFHVCSDDHCQRYQGLQTLSPSNLEAVRSTAGEVLISPSGKLVDARFSKCCGGTTELFSTCWQNHEEDCLESLRDPWCNLSDYSPIKREEILSSILKDYDRKTDGYGFLWKTEVPKKLIVSNLLKYFNIEIGDIQSLQPLHRGPSGRIDLLRIHGYEKSVDIGKELWIRRVLSDTHLYSSAIEITDKGDSFQLEGKGWGHGVGLCQIGAANMALHGFNYKAILEFYYPGASVKHY